MKNCAPLVSSLCCLLWPRRIWENRNTTFIRLPKTVSNWNITNITCFFFYLPWAQYIVYISNEIQKITHLKTFVQHSFLLFTRRCLYFMRAMYCNEKSSNPEAPKVRLEPIFDGPQASCWVGAHSQRWHFTAGFTDSAWLF